MLKLTDFGLRGLRAASSSITKNSHQYFRSKLWTAPEVLRSDPELLQVAALLLLKIYEPQLRLLAAVLHGALPPAAGVACGGRGGRGDDQGGRVQVEVYRCTVYSVQCTMPDVYSFAIILHEISARAGVWGGTLGPDVSRAAALSTYLLRFRYITAGF